nr:MAG TPA: hypothetical protein [Bacteriophage sp.]
MRWGFIYLQNTPQLSRSIIRNNKKPLYINIYLYYYYHIMHILYNYI